jgi:hypothetical protein
MKPEVNVLAGTIQHMRRLLCAALILMSLLQWSWAGVHAASEASHSATHSQQSQSTGAPSADADSHEECCVQAHCCHPHATALLSETLAAMGHGLFSLTPSVRAMGTPGALPAEIERPKWVLATPAVATV